MIIQHNARLVMIGDSITDAGRARPVGEGRGPAMGEGYVRLVSAHFAARHPQAGIHVMNTGIGGDQVPHLKARWQRDVMDLRPDWVSVLIGINDVWRFFDCPDQPDIHVDLECYTATLDELVTRTLPEVEGMVVMAPYMIENNRQDPMRHMMDLYGAAARSIARERGAVFADTQRAFDDVLEHVHSYYFASDRIHPNTAGHMVIANCFLDAVGA